MSGSRSRHDRKQQKLVHQKRRDQVAHLAHIEVTTTESYRGPIPHPSHLAQLDLISAGLAERTVAMAERQQSHRQDLERRTVYSRTTQETVGMWMSFMLNLLVIGLAGVLTVKGYAIAGVVGLIWILALFSTKTAFGFIRSRRNTTDGQEKSQSQMPLPFGSEKT